MSFVDEKVLDLCGLRVKKGQFGIEVEVDENLREILMEAERGEVPSLADWSITRDSSLKSANALEFVLRNPLDLKEAAGALDKLYKKLKATVKMEDKMTAGIHIHVNVQQMTVREMTNFLVLYWCLEPLIIHQFGDNRKGNLFCLGIEDSDFPMDMFRRAVRSKDLRSLANDQLKYAACNISVIPAYGSIEFRAMQTPTEAQVVIDWIAFLQRLVDVSKGFKSPRDILAQFSMEGPQALYNLIGKAYAKWLAHPKADAVTTEAVRNVQQAVYELEF